MKKSELLKKAKKYLWDGKDLESYHSSKEMQEFICFAVRQAGSWDGNLTVEGRVSLELQAWIEELIGMGHSVPLEQWLQEHHPSFPRDDDLMMQKLRHKWINWMIAYWQKQGQ